MDYFNFFGIQYVPVDEQKPATFNKDSDLELLDIDNYPDFSDNQNEWSLAKGFSAHFESQAQI